MTYAVILIFAIGTNLTAIQLSNKTYSKVEDCLAAATAATRTDLFSNNYLDMLRVIARHNPDLPNLRAIEQQHPKFN